MDTTRGRGGPSFTERIESRIESRPDGDAPDGDAPDGDASDGDAPDGELAAAAPEATSLTSALLGWFSSISSPCFFFNSAVVRAVVVGW